MRIREEAVIDCLREELELRRQNTAKYSLGAFAGYLKIDLSALSRLLSGDRRLTEAMFEKITTAFGWSGTKADEFREVASVKARLDLL